MKFPLIILGALAFVVLSLFLYSWYRLRVMVVNHIPPDPALPSDYQLENEEHEFTSSDGLKLSGWYIPTPDAKAVVILLHGYGSPRGGKPHMLAHAKYLNEAGYSTFLYDGRGFGESEGNKITLGVDEWKDAEAAYDFVKSLPQNKNRKVGFLGVSLGGVISIITAGKTGKGDFVIAATPYASLDREFRFQIRREGFPSFTLPLLRLAAQIELGKNYDKHSAEAMVKRIRAPLLIISAKEDSEVNPEDPKYLFELANSQKELWEAETGHDVFSNNPGEFRKRVLDFLNAI